jgi:predicted TIM-barrel fold metal-dependent hydrolase
MKTCAYPYCRHPVIDDEKCQRCGFPTDKALLADLQFLISSSPQLDLDAVIDMHQILRNETSAVEKQIHMMDRLNIRKVLLQSVPDGTSSIFGNRELLRAAQVYKDRFWVSQFLDPRSPNALSLLTDWHRGGIRVVKLLPCLGYRPDDSSFDAIWEVMEKHSIAVMAHTGFITARHKEEERKAGVYLNSTYCDPLLWDRPARRFPNLQIILCHLGGQFWYREASVMITEHQNVWADVSGSGLMALHEVLRNRMSVDFSKIFWGNDGSTATYPFSMKLTYDALNEHGLERLVPALFHDNASRFASDFL